MYQVWVTTRESGNLGYALSSEHEVLDEARDTALERAGSGDFVQVEIRDTENPDESALVVGGYEWDEHGRIGCSRRFIQS